MIVAYAGDPDLCAVMRRQDLKVARNGIGLGVALGGGQDLARNSAGWDVLAAGGGGHHFTVGRYPPIASSPCCTVNLPLDG